MSNFKEELASLIRENDLRIRADIESKRQEEAEKWQREQDAARRHALEIYLPVFKTRMRKDASHGKVMAEFRCGEMPRYSPNFTLLSANAIKNALMEEGIEATVETRNDLISVERGHGHYADVVYVVAKWSR